jgi:hypothetical protein
LDRVKATLPQLLFITLIGAFTKEVPGNMLQLFHLQGMQAHNSLTMVCAGLNVEVLLPLRDFILKEVVLYNRLSGHPSFSLPTIAWNVARWHSEDNSLRRFHFYTGIQTLG